MQNGSTCITATMSARCNGGNPLEVAQRMLATLQENLLEGMTNPNPLLPRQFKTRSLCPVEKIGIRVTTFQTMAKIAIELKSTRDEILKELEFFFLKM